MDNNQQINQKTQYVIEIAIRLGFLALLVAWCLQLLYPFAGVVVWALILALATAPIYNMLNRWLGDKPSLSAALLVIVGLIVIIIPSWLFFDSFLAGINQLEASMEAGSLVVPPPSPKVADWPLFGDEIYGFWAQAASNLDDFLIRYDDQVNKMAIGLVNGVANMGGSVLQLILSTIIAGVLLATKGTADFTQRFFYKLVGSTADEFANIVTTTVQNVLRGVVGVALIQALLVGIGFLLAGVPYAGLWTLLVFVLAILQLPVLLLIIFVIIWLFSVMNPLPAVLWTIYLLLAGASDNVLKPILLGKGAAVPMVVIFLGVIGGFMLSGFIGLFTGAIIISLGYKLFIAWINKDKI
ncbi:AI-2E family transporter [Maribellus mangrovi]|uniref:AI-2E family transporter n=1 Tax=Maribellus mangrovi TaxID=3133146 RepID=UPI0030EEE0F8